MTKEKDKRINNNLQNTKVRATWTSLKTGSELGCSEGVGSSCSTSGTRRITLATNTVISHEWGTDKEVLTTNGTYALSFVTQIFRTGSTKTWWLGSVVSLLAVTLYQGNPDRNHKRWNIRSTEKHVLHM